MIASCPKKTQKQSEVVHKQFELKASAFSPKPKLRLKSLMAKKVSQVKVVVDEILVAAGWQPNVESPIWMQLGEIGQTRN